MPISQLKKRRLSGRETEARVLTQGAVKLVDCQKHWNAQDHRDKLNTALTYNQRIWSIFQVEISNPGNPLPENIKRNILQLSQFIDNRIFDIMAFPSPEKLNILIDINRNIAAGLRTTGIGPVD